MASGSSRGLMDRRVSATVARVLIVSAALIMAFSFLWLGTVLNRLYRETYDGFPDDAWGEAAMRPQPKPGERINILLLGLDAPQEGYTLSRSDTVMVASIDPLLNEIGVLSVPRDTLVYIPGYDGARRAGSAYAYRGASLAMDTMSRLLGVPIHYYATVSFGGFVNLVDILGPVEIVVDTHMEYEDPCQDLFIDISPGVHQMSGQEALEYVRFRADDAADIGRVARQQYFLTQMLRQSIRVGTIFKLPQILAQLEANVRHSLPGSIVTKLMLMAPGIGPDRVTVGTLPGETAWVGERNLYVVDWEMGSPLVDRLLRGIDPGANAGVVVEVVNASGIPGTAEEMARRLAVWGYDVRIGPDAGGINVRTQVVTVSTDAGAQLLARCIDTLLTGDEGADLYCFEHEVEGIAARVMVGLDFGR